MKKQNTNIIYYIAFLLAVCQRLIINSTLINISTLTNFVLVLIISLLFVIKIITDKHTLLELIAIFIAVLCFLYIYIKIEESLLLISFLGFVAIKNVNIRTVVKIDLIIKLIFLLSHSALYFINYSLDFSSISSMIIYNSKGISHALYFKNPNNAGYIMLWIIFDIIYLKRQLKFWNIVLLTTLMYFGYSITKTRTAFYTYLIFIIMYYVKNYRVLDFVQKSSYLICVGLSYYVVRYMSIGSDLYQKLNNLFSNRLGYSIQAFNETKMNILPNFLNQDFFSTYVIDNFYVRCFIYYGLITLLLFYIPNLFIPNKKYLLEKKIFIVTNIYLFFENVAINIGCSVAYLIMADIIFNKKREVVQDE